MEYPFSPDQITDFFYSETWKQIFYLIKLISGFVSFALFVGIVILGIKTKKFGERIGKMVSSLEAVSEIKGKEKIMKKWQEIVVKASSHVDSDRKISVIEADKLMDDLIKKIGFKGKDMGERLKQINTNQISNIDEIWQAHKIRNNIAHDPYFKLTSSDADFVIKTYENTLKELGII